jgi:hypothetical protein
VESKLRRTLDLLTAAVLGLGVVSALTSDPGSLERELRIAWPVLPATATTVLLPAVVALEAFLCVELAAGAGRLIRRSTSMLFLLFAGVQLGLGVHAGWGHHCSCLRVLVSLPVGVLLLVDLAIAIAVVDGRTQGAGLRSDPVSGSSLRERVRGGVNPRSPGG